MAVIKHITRHARVRAKERLGRDLTFAEWAKLSYHIQHQNYLRAASCSDSGCYELMVPLMGGVLHFVFNYATSTVITVMRWHRVTKPSTPLPRPDQLLLDADDGGPEDEAAS